MREITESLRQTVEQKFPYVWVKGEATNVSRPSSGHVYFALKEGDELLGCVWFRGQQRERENFDPLTGEVWEGGPRPSLARTLNNGQEIVCAGRMSVYGPRGSYQLIVDLAQESGQGNWHQAFEDLKQKLAKEGFFGQERKRSIPHEPRRVAVITALTGAALQDFIRIASERGLGAKIRIHPTPVQGEEAPPKIVAALQEVNEQAWAQVVVIIRGGGSIQDLWAFNEEIVARAVFASKIPVLTGVGHEIDHSIADFVADRAAATPSHAAQLLWSERTAHMQRIDDMEGALRQAFTRKVQLWDGHLNHVENSLRLLSPSRKLKTQQDRLEALEHRVQAEMQRILQRETEQVRALEVGLRRWGGPPSLQANVANVERLDLRLHAAGRERLMKAEHRLTTLAARLKGLDPHAPLARGYAIVKRHNHVLRSINDISCGEIVEIEVNDGALSAQVLDKAGSTAKK